MIDKNSSQQYDWGKSCKGWHLVKSDSLSVIQELMPPHTSEQSHKHGNSRQFFFILSGEATIEINGSNQKLVTGQGQEVAPGEIHRVFNNTDADLEFMVISCPPSHTDRINI